MAEEAAVGFVIESFAKLVIEETKFLAGVSEQVEELQCELERLQSFLRDAQARKNEKRDIQVWILQSRDLAYEAEDLLEEYAFRISSQRDNFYKRITSCFLNECHVRHSIGSKIQRLKTRISNTIRSFQEYGITPLIFSNGREDSSSSSQRHQSREYSHVANDDFIKSGNDVEMLVKHLVNENDDDLYEIVSIFGMAGLGKTTLARKVYNHAGVQDYFDHLAWVCISQHLQKRDVLQGILLKFFKEKRKDIEEWRDEELMRELSRTFRNKKCMVVLDDIWSIEAWECIKEAFPLRKNGSKIFITTRNRSVALHMGPNGFHHEPRLLNDMESWELLQIKALGVEPQNVDEQMCKRKELLGKEMAKYCGGLPLAVVVLGGILARKKGIEEWKMVHDDVKAHIGRGGDTIEEQGGVKKILALSYDDLPLKLKPCFLYLGRYLEDSKIDVERLYQLWIAEGMISEEDQISDESMMDIAERYLRELAERSLVQVEVNEDMERMTRFKCCHLHDLVRDMNLEKVREEHFFSLVHSVDDFNDEVYKFSSLSSKIHRLVIHVKESDHLLKYVPPQRRETRHLRSVKLEYKGPLAPTIFSQISRFRMLRSLEITEVLYRGNLCDPSGLRHIDSLKVFKGIGCLIHLRYLSLSLNAYLSVYLPLSFGNLKQLQTLNLQTFGTLRIPNILRKMTQLRHLYLPVYLKNSTHDKLTFDGLNKLEILEGFNSRNCCFGDLVKLTSLRWLQADLYFEDENFVQRLMLLLDSKSLKKINLGIYSLDNDRVGTTEERSTFFKKLFSCEKVLKLRIGIPIGNLPKYETRLVSNLVDLSLACSELEEDPMETLGKLSNLKYLYLCKNSFLGTQMTCNSATFLKLRTLGLCHLPNLKELIIVEGAMPILWSLEICGCKELEMISEGLQFIKTLKMLTVWAMHKNFNRRIQVIDGQEGEDYYKIKHVPSIEVLPGFPMFHA